MPLRLATWNVEYAKGAAKNAARLARILSEKADIWVLTETHDDLSLLPTHGSVTTVQRPTGRQGGRWTAIWSRWPLADVAVDDPVRTVAAVVSTPAGPLLVYGTVLPWGTDPGPDLANPAKGWTEMDRVLPLQLAEWGRLRDAHPGVPLVVAGDLNMNIGGPHVYGTKRCRTALLAGLPGLGLACATSADRVPSGALRAPVIDHVLVPSSWSARVASAWEGTNADGIDLSDHSGVVVEVADFVGP
jgi:endonuclease/exonuclease/phosphatase family metal-dependent hydrolase